MTLLEAHTQPCFVTTIAYLANTAFLKEKTKGDRKKKKVKIYMDIKQKLFTIYNSVCIDFKRYRVRVLLSFTTKLCPQPTNTTLITDYSSLRGGRKADGLVNQCSPRHTFHKML